MTKLTLELEGEAYADGLATADKFLALMTERLDRIDKITDNILDLTNMNADALDDIRAAIKDLEEANPPPPPPRYQADPFRNADRRPRWDTAAVAESQEQRKTGIRGWFVERLAVTCRGRTWGDGLGKAPRHLLGR